MIPCVRIAVVTMVVLSIVVPVHAQQRAANSSLTAELPAEFRQFDFWIGKWSIVQDGAPGTSTDTVKRVGDGVGIVEKYRDPAGGTGSSVTMYNLATGTWTQTYSQGGQLLQVTGGLVGGRMILTRTVESGGVARLERLIFENIKSRTLDQIYESSTDDGQTWQRVYTTHWTKMR